MAPQTLHLQAVAGRAAASRHPRAQAVIYTGLCICLSRTQHNTTETALPFTSQPESGTIHLTKSHAMSEIQWDIKSGGRLRQDSRHANSSRPLYQLGKLKLENSQRDCAKCVRVRVSVSLSLCMCMCMHVCTQVCVCVCVCECFQGAWSLPMAEPWKRGFHPGLSLIREGSLIPSHPMLWFICILCQEVMEFCSTVCSENLEDVV